ncbi:helix-turn-helix domain-containing protein [Pelagibaculum spongiae]|uniref:AraC family transcriptional regulator n=1 Tax=Pelagibaculum spongiae TaxID=2080658 RepID=A0A2V1H2J0_9GAMM|nr:helix-turn-helix domain-containing protein [Pelagibaculum spongiae]PVZ70611.1 AraC family transcriptional regulator [Pelagibaculum spongiae]
MAQTTVSPKVAILAHPQASLFELGCAVELFGLPRPEINHWYATQVVAWQENQLSALCGIQLQITKISCLDKFSHLVIPYWPVNNTEIDQKLRQAIIQFYQAGKVIVSFCSGSFLLAEIDLLNNRNATTHWRYAEQFKARFPQINYVDDVLYLFDGKLGCSAGSAAALDLGIEVIRQDYGYQIANQVARRLVMSAHRAGGQSQFVQTPLLAVPNQFAATLDWVISHLADPIDIDFLAAKANMSRRTFDRKFRSSFNLSAQQWLSQQRIIKAKQLLESESHAVEKVAELSGFNNATAMRHYFRKLVGVTPVQYRKQFSS